MRRLGDANSRREIIEGMPEHEVKGKP